MRALIILAAGLLIAARPAFAGGVNLDYENFYLDKGRAKIVLKVNNSTGKRLDVVIAECAFLDGKNRAVDVATLIASDVEASAYVDGWSATVGGIKHAHCRVSSYR